MDPLSDVRIRVVVCACASADAGKDGANMRINVPWSARRVRTCIVPVSSFQGMRPHGGEMPKFPVIASVAVLLCGCMSGPIPVSSSNNGVKSTAMDGPSEEKLPGAPAVRAATP